MRKTMIYIASTALMIGTVVASCKKDTIDLTEEPLTQTLDCETISYGTDIQPIFATYCATAGCHQSGQQFPDLSTHPELIDDTLTIRRRALIQGNMPPAGNPSPTQEELDMLRCWLDEGAPNN